MPLPWYHLILSRSRYSAFCEREDSSRGRFEPFRTPGGLQMKLPNFVSGQWKEGAGAGELLVDPVTGEELARISSQGIDARAALEFARSNGGPDGR